MKIPERSPDVTGLMDSGVLSTSPEVIGFVKEFNEKYLHWDDLRYRDTGNADRTEVWKVMKFLRMMSCDTVDIGDLRLSYSISDGYIQQTLQRVDSRMASGILPSNGIDRKSNTILSVSSVMEESIASSQLEGASTTTKVAKRLLRSNQQPKDRSERMILNNYRAMQLIKERIDRPLSSELIKEIHRVITDGLMDDPSASGKFRDDDTIAIRAVYEDVTYHVPVRHDRIAGMIDSLCEYANTDGRYVHPIVKGIIIHYVLAYIHPFLDGNGRVSRSLFYWYCMKNGYSVMEYLSISRMIKEHRSGYDKAFLLSETDDEDITYFIRYNLKMISDSIDQFVLYVKQKNSEQMELSGSLQERDLNNRQIQILRDMRNNRVPVSQYELSAKYQTSVPTIRRDLIRLLDEGLIRTCGKDGHRQLYIYDGDRILYIDEK